MESRRRSYAGLPRCKLALWRGEKWVRFRGSDERKNGNRGTAPLVASVARSTVYSCLLNYILGIGFGLYFCEMCAALLFESRAPIQKNGFVSSWTKYASLIEAVLNHCEFLASGSGHRLALRTDVPLNTQHRSADEG